MLPPLLRLAAARPELLAEHLLGYAELAGVEGASVAAAWRRQAMLQGAALCGVAVSATLAGVAGLLAAALPLAAMPAPWALWALPVVPLAAAVLCQAVAARAEVPLAFASLRRQWQADLQLLADAGGGA